MKITIRGRCAEIIYDHGEKFYGERIELIKALSKECQAIDKNARETFSLTRINGHEHMEKK